MTDSAIIAIAAAISIAFSTIGPAMGQGKTAAVMLTASTMISVLVTVKPMTAEAYTAASAITVAMPH